MGEPDVGGGLQGPLQRDRRPAPAHDERVGGAEGVPHSEDMLVLWVKMHSRRILHKNALRGFLPRWMYLEMAVVRAMISSLAAIFSFNSSFSGTENPRFFRFPSSIHLQFYFEQYFLITVDFKFVHIFPSLGSDHSFSAICSNTVDCYCSSPLLPPGIFPSRSNA